MHRLYRILISIISVVKVGEQAEGAAEGNFG